MYFHYTTVKRSYMRKVTVKTTEYKVNTQWNIPSATLQK